MIEIDLNRCLSQKVRNLASPNIVVIVLWNDGYDELLLSHHGHGASPRQASLINPSLMLLWKCNRELALYLNNVADVGFKLLNLLPLLSYLNVVCNNLNSYSDV